MADNVRTHEILRKHAGRLHTLIFHRFLSSLARSIPDTGWLSFKLSEPWMARTPDSEIDRRQDGLGH